MRISKLMLKCKKRLFAVRFKFASYEKKAALLREQCYHVGRNTRICNSDFGDEPYMISIGDDVIVASGVRFIEHDASVFSVYRYLNRNPDGAEKIGKIMLRNNCFIGAHSILLPGTDVGENSIIAAGSLVNKKIPANEVWGGVPAHLIMSLDEYANKVLSNVNNLPWFDSRKKLTQNELITQRQKYFFNDN